MTRRPGFVVDHWQSADGGTPPNQYHPLISVQVRCNWPPRASMEEIRQALMDGYEKAVAELDFHRHEWARGAQAYRYDWTE